MFEIIKAQMVSAVPFATTTGIEIVEIAAGTATCVLEQRADVSNHIGSMHAGALFTLGETASGAAMTGAFAMQLGSVRPIATGASIAYTRIAKGRITAHAKLAQPAADLLATLDAEGKVRFDVEVTLSEAGGDPVATMTVGWLVSKR